MGVLQKKFELDKLEIAFIIIVILGLVGAGFYAWSSGKKKENGINSFAECVAAGNPVMESYPEQCAANGQSWSNPEQQAQQPEDTAPTAAEQLAEEAVRVPLSTVPEGLRAAILAEARANTPDCVQGDNLVDADGQAVDPNVIFASLSSAAIPLGCGEGGYQALFGINKEGEWQFAQGTQSLYDCNVIQQYAVPKSLLVLAQGQSDDQVVCFDQSTQAERPVDSLWL